MNIQIWTTANGTQIPINNLTNSHLLNVQRIVAERARDLNDIQSDADLKISNLKILTKHHEDSFDERFSFTTNQAYDELFATVTEATTMLKKALSNLKVISTEVDTRSLKRLPLREQEK